MGERIGAKGATPRRDLSPEEKKRKKAERKDFKELTKLKRFYGRAVLVMMAIQLAVVNYIFWEYAEGWDWRPPVAAVQVFFVATFVQIVSIVVVITRSLFPKRVKDDS